VGQLQHSLHFCCDLSEQNGMFFFEIKEMTGDKAYSSRKNLALIDGLGGTAFIPFTS